MTLHRFKAALIAAAFLLPLAAAAPAAAGHLDHRHDRGGHHAESRHGHGHDRAVHNRFGHDRHGFALGHRRHSFAHGRHGVRSHAYGGRFRYGHSRHGRPYAYGHPGLIGYLVFGHGSRRHHD